MEITSIKVFPVDEERLKAFATIVFDGCFVIRDLKVINGNKGLFVAMPSKRCKDGTFKDMAHPLNSDTRSMIEDKVLKEYFREKDRTDAHGGQSTDEFAEQFDTEEILANAESATTPVADSDDMSEKGM